MQLSVGQVRRYLERDHAEHHPTRSPRRRCRSRGGVRVARARYPRIVSAAPKPAWLLAAEATGTADYTYSPGLIDALIALPPSKRKGVAINPEKFDTDMQLELARALHAGYAELTPEGRLRITPSGDTGG